jgi:hypothetical protein
VNQCPETIARQLHVEFWGLSRLLREGVQYINRLRQSGDIDDPICPFRMHAQLPNAWADGTYRPPVRRWSALLDLHSSKPISLRAAAAKVRTHSRLSPIHTKGLEVIISELISCGHGRPYPEMSRSIRSRLVKLSCELQTFQDQSPPPRSRGSRARHPEIGGQLLGHRRDSSALHGFGPKQIRPQDAEAQELGSLFALRSSNDALEDKHHRRKIARHGCMYRLEANVFH